MILVNQEFVAATALQALWLEEFFREVFFIVGNDRVRAGSYGGCKEVAVLRIGLHCRNEILVPGNQCILESGFHGCDSAFYLFTGTAKLREGIRDFIQNLAGPPRSIESWLLSQSQKRISQRHRGQHARIQYGDVLVDYH